MSDHRDRIREKLRRLLSMTTENGASENEALAAAEAAARLMAEHNLSYRTIDEIDAEGFGANARDWFRGSKGRFKSAPIPPVVRCLAAICDLCGVEHSFNTFTGELSFFGAPSDTEVAHYLTVIISRAMDTEWASAKRRLPAVVARRRRASFYLGMSLRIAQRLMAMQEAAPQAQGTGLVLVKNALVKERFAQANPDLKTHRSNIDAKDLYGVRDGLEAGSRVPLNKGINEAHGALAICVSTPSNAGGRETP